MSKAGLEAILFQSNSSLGRNISSTITKAFQYRNAIDYSRVPEKERIKHRQKLMLEYCANILGPELKKIVKNDCGIIIEEVLLGQNASGLFACSFNYNQNAVGVLMNRMAGLKYVDKGLKKTVEELSSSLSLNIDLKESKANITKDVIKMDLYFDYLLSFCMYDFIPQSVSDEFTPDEITAILLHEIGHAYTFAEHAIDTCYKMRSVEDKFKNVSKLLIENKDYKETAEVIKEKLIPMMKDINGVPEELIKVSYKISDKIDDCLEYGKETSIGNKIVFGYLMVLIKIFNIFTMITASIYKVIYKRGLFNFLKGILELRVYKKIENVSIDILTDYMPNGELFFFKKSDRSNNSDVAVSMFNIRTIESRADEFAVRHGYGSYLASGLTKLHDIFEYFSLNNIYLIPTLQIFGMRDGFRSNVIIISFFKAALFMINVFGLKPPSLLNAVDMPLKNSELSYDKEVDRIKRGLTDLKGVFKENLDPKSMAKWILEYERMQSSLDECKNRSRNYKISNFMKSVWDILLFDPTSFKSQMGKYDKFLTQINEIINNELYFNAAKFRQLASLK